MRRDLKEARTAAIKDECAHGPARRPLDGTNRLPGKASRNPAGSVCVQNACGMCNRGTQAGKIRH